MMSWQKSESPLQQPGQGQWGAPGQQWQQRSASAPPAGQQGQQGPPAGQQWQQGPPAGEQWQQGPPGGQQWQQGPPGSQQWQQGPPGGQQWQQGYGLPWQQSCCCPQPGAQGPVDPYICAQPMPNEPPNAILQCCSYTVCLLVFFSLMTVIGFAVVIGANSADNIFNAFSVSNTSALQAAIAPYTNQTFQINRTTFAKAPSTIALFGSFGNVVDSDSLNAAVLAVQLSNWNNFRGTLWFLAMMLTLFMLLLTCLVHRQRHPTNMIPPTDPNGQQFFPPSPQIQVPAAMYEMFRVGWGVCSFIVMFWVGNAIVSYQAFVRYYLDNTTGPLNVFWVTYDKKFIPSVVCVTIYLCWPLAHFALEIALWFVGLIPWMMFRCMCKPGLENLRYPDLPIDDVPGYVRIDQFFTEANDLKRLGFTRQAWELMTQTKEPFFTCDAFGGQQYPGQQMPGAYPQPPPQPTTTANRPPPMSPPRPGSAQGPTDETPNRSVTQPQMPYPYPYPQQAPVEMQGYEGATTEDATRSSRKKDKADKKEKREKKEKEKKR